MARCTNVATVLQFYTRGFGLFCRGLQFAGPPAACSRPGKSTSITHLPCSASTPQQLTLPHHHNLSIAAPWTLRAHVIYLYRVSTWQIQKCSNDSLADKQTTASGHLYGSGHETTQPKPLYFLHAKTSVTRSSAHLPCCRATRSSPQ